MRKVEDDWQGIQTFKDGIVDAVVENIQVASINIDVDICR